jgi:hypothetical protein
LQTFYESACEVGAGEGFTSAKAEFEKDESAIAPALAHTAVALFMA